jgi:hypothetical protein
VIALVALFVALGGTALALSKNTVGSKQLKPSAVKSGDLAADAVTSPKVDDGSLLASDFAPGALPQGPQGPQGERGARGAQGPRGSAGPPGRSALDTLRSGETVRGVASIRAPGPQTWVGESLPIPAPEPLDSFDVRVVGFGTNDDDFGECTGTASNPTAPPGFVCAYLAIVPTGNIVNAYGYGISCSCANQAATGDGQRFGFNILLNGSDSNQMVATFTWAYTAP